MTILNAAWDAANATVEAGGVFTFITAPGTPAKYDSAFARSCFDLTNTTFIGVAVGSSVSEAWFHTSWHSASLNSGSGTGALFTFRSAANANADQIRLVSVAQASNIHRLKFQKSTNGGSSWADITSTPTTFDQASGSLVRFDIHVKIDASVGMVELYVNEVLALTFTGNTSTQNNVFDKVICHGFGISSGDHDYVSEMIWSSTTTVGYRLFNMFPNASGAQSDFGGTFAEIDDIGAIDNTDFINSDTVGHISFFNMNDIGSTFSRYGIVGTVMLAGVAISADATIADLQLAYRNAGGTNFFNSSTGYTHDSSVRIYKDIRENSPFTSIGWSMTEVNGLQIGVKAV